MSRSLTKLEKTQLGACETAIEKGVKSVGENLLTIRDQRLYRASYGTFEEYCEQRWGFKKSYANRLITAGKTAARLGTIVTKDQVPTAEGHLREIAKAPEEKQAEVLQTGQKMAAESGRTPTAKDYADARKMVAEEYEYVLDDDTAEIVQDKAGRTVPVKFLTHVGTRAAINATAHKFNALIREIEALADREGGEFIAAQDLAERAKMVKGDLMQSAYWTHCPRCSGKPGCELCDGNGFMPERHRGYLTAEEKAVIR